MAHLLSSLYLRGILRSAGQPTVGQCMPERKIKKKSNGSSKPNWSSPCLASRQTPNRYGWFISRWEAENDTSYTERKSELDSAYPLHACWWVVLRARALRNTATGKAEPTQWGALHLWKCVCLVKFYLRSLLLSVTSQRPLFPDSGSGATSAPPFSFSTSLVTRVFVNPCANAIGFKILKTQDCYQCEDI